MKTSEMIDKLAEALSLARKEFKPVIKNKQNPHFKNWYADLSSIFDATVDSLSKYGIALTQAPAVFEGRVTVLTRLIHKSGQWLESELSLKPTADTPQAIGSAITYARRYSAQSILGIDAETDDDGNIASATKDPKLAAAQSKSGLVDLGPQAQFVVFDCKNPKHLEWVEVQLKERSISADKHDAIAKAVHGYTRKTFEDFLVHKGYKPAQGWVE